MNLTYKRNFILSTKAESLIDIIKQRIMQSLFFSRIPSEAPENECEQSLSDSLTRQLSSSSTDTTLSKRKANYKKKIDNCANSKVLHSEITMSDISLNSDKTDCEEKFSRHKIVINPLDKNGVYEILSDYFSEINYNNSDEFYNYLSSSNTFLNNFEQAKTAPVIKNHYMRKSVCMKFYKIFEKLVRYY